VFNIAKYQRRGDSCVSLGGKDRLESAIKDYEKAKELAEDETTTNTLNSKIKKVS
jgi:predicted negative regulator of RcsB-dependent stress response